MKPQIHFTGDQDTGDFRLEYTGNISTEAGMLRLYLHLARAFGFEVPRTRFDREDWNVLPLAKPEREA